MFRESEKEIASLLDVMNIDSDCVVVSQCNKDNKETFSYKGHCINAIYSTERGLSKSRNLALKYADADIVIIADDDICYVDGYSKKIIEAYDKINNADIITFKVRRDKKYFIGIKKLNKIWVHKITSYEITMRLNKIKDIHFNEIFGTGSGCFLHGEENIFLTDCVRKGKRIYYYPQMIAGLLENERPSTWFAGYNKKYFIDQGALYYNLSKYLVYFYVLQFAFRKYKLYKGHFGVMTVLYYMMKGIREYKNTIRRN
jgi:glycosyltransferase involved in cell wall biosynthesis